MATPVTGEVEVRGAAFEEVVDYAKRLHAELRKIAIKPISRRKWMHCGVCYHTWVPGEAEDHAGDCLAANARKEVADAP